MSDKWLPPMLLAAILLFLWSPVRTFIKVPGAKLNLSEMLAGAWGIVYVVSAMNSDRPLGLTPIVAFNLFILGMIFFAVTNLISRRRGRHR